MTTIKFSLGTPARIPLLSWHEQSALMPVSLIVYIGAPMCMLLASKGNPLYLSAYAPTFVGKITCYALAVLVLNLVWDYCDTPSLDHRLFFALGGYGMGIHPMRSIGREGVYKNDLPDSMVFPDWKELFWFWHGAGHSAQVMLLAILMSGVLAWLSGLFVFHPRIKGVYLSIITQAMTHAATLLFLRNETGSNSSNGFINSKHILDFPIFTLSTRAVLLMVTFVTLVLAFIAYRVIVMSKSGRMITVIRDAEARVVFSGYNPFDYKPFVWTFSVVLCGIIGALYMPQVSIISPDEMSLGNSIEMVVWVAVGGCGALINLIIGALLVNGARTLLTIWVPGYWLFMFGAIFAPVTPYLPNGVLGLMSELHMRKRAPA